MLLAELLAQLLRPVYGQAVVCPVPWVKTDDIVVAFHIFPFLVFLIAKIGSHTGNGEIRAAISDLAALKFEVLQKVGEAVGNIQTYQL